MINQSFSSPYLETPGSPTLRRSTTDRQLSLTTANKLREEDDKTRRLPERQISSPSSFGSISKAKERIEDEKEKDEKLLEGNQDVRLLSETPFANAGGVNSSERLLPSSTPIQDLPAFARRVLPSTSSEEEKGSESRIGFDGQPGTENKGRKGTGNLRPCCSVKLMVSESLSCPYKRNFWLQNLALTNLERLNDF